MAMTQETRHGLLNHVYRGIPMESPATVYLGLFVAGVEVTGKGYARQAITFGAPVDDVVKSDKEVRFPIASADWGDIEGAAIFTASVGGTISDKARIGVVRNVRANDQFTVPIGSYMAYLEDTESVVNGTV